RFPQCPRSRNPPVRNSAVRTGRYCRACPIAMVIVGSNLRHARAHPRQRATPGVSAQRLTSACPIALTERDALPAISADGRGATRRKNLGAVIREVRLMARE